MGVMENKKKPIVWLWTWFGLTILGCGGTADMIYERYPYLAPGSTVAYVGITPQQSPEPMTMSTTAPRLEQLVEQLLQNGPMVQKARADYLADANGTTLALGFPELDVRVTTPPISNGFQDGTVQIEIMQMIPSPPAWIANVVAAGAQKDSARWKFEAAIRSAVTDLYRMYAELAYIDSALQVVRNNREIAGHIGSLGAKNFAQGSGTLVDVTRVMAQLAQLEYDRITLEEKRTTLAVQIAAMVGSSLSDAKKWTAVAPLHRVRIPQDAHQLQTLMLSHRPQLLAMDDEIRMGEAMVAESKGMWFPDLAIGAMVMVGDGNPTAAHSASSGETDVALMFGMSFPWSFYATAAGVRQKNAKLEAMVWEKKAEVDTAIASLEEKLFQMRNAERLFTLYDEVLLPRAQQAMDAAFILAQQQHQNPDTMPELLEARAAWYTFSLGKQRAVTDLFVAAVMVENLVGIPLIQAAEGEVTP
ncbi:MAG: TolC family protein [Myxococcales bacterium]|nr:TolC family protein [Myxococcales bacterium]